MVFGREEPRILKTWEGVWFVNGKTRIFRAQGCDPAEAMKLMEEKAKKLHVGKWEDEENRFLDPEGDLAVFGFAVLREFPLSHYGVTKEMKNWNGQVLCKSKPSPVGMAVFSREGVTCPDCLEIMRQIECSKKN